MDFALGEKEDDMGEIIAVNFGDGTPPMYKGEVIVRCGDCKYYNKMEKTEQWGRCYIHGSRVCQEVDFCSWGERIQDET